MPTEFLALNGEMYRPVPPLNLLTSAEFCVVLVVPVSQSALMVAVSICD